MIRRHRVTGGTIGRVHVVTRPPSNYLRFEFRRYYRHQAPVHPHPRRHGPDEPPGRCRQLLDVRPLHGRPDEVRR
ncbi:DUF6879 family protein [Streptomyces alboniger]|uniref:DUF6879 family protein n=1 Tax=Streptomyces alboniger TaxID=132473 RepID=UPI00319E41DA